jgi:hypothetical protein
MYLSLSVREILADNAGVVILGKIAAVQQFVSNLWFSGGVQKLINVINHV